MDDTKKVAVIEESRASIRRRFERIDRALEA